MIPISEPSSSSHTLFAARFDNNNYTMRLPQDTTYMVADNTSCTVGADDTVCRSDSGIFDAATPWLATLSLLTMAFYALKFKLRRDRARSPLKGVDVVPSADWLLGHLSHVFAASPNHNERSVTGKGRIDGDDNNKNHPFLFSDNANASGISAFWIFSTPCASVLKAEHVRAVLRHTSTRDYSRFVIRHGLRTLGSESLILIEGGPQWKRQRNIIGKAFTASSLIGSRRVVCDVAEDMTGLLLKACVENDAQGSVCVDMTVFFKSFGLDVFGQVALGHDFKCMAAAERSIQLVQQQAKEGVDSDEALYDEKGGITRIRMPKEAEAFDYLVQDISVRGEPRSLLNPAVQCYWVPTAHNREYAEKFDIVQTVLHNIINRHKEAVRKEMEDDMAAFEDKKQYRNMLTHLILASDNNATADELSKIITTLLFAGYETSAISLSYAMHCLATHPDVQDKCAEESRNAFRNKRSRWGSGDHRQSPGSSFDEDDNNSEDEGNEESSTSSSLYSTSDFDSQDSRELISEEDLPYCRAALIESMRLHATVLFTTRKLTKPLTLDGIDLPEGMRMYIPMNNIHHDERNFTRATEYIPERWVRWEENNDIEGGGRWVERDHLNEAKEREIWNATHSEEEAEDYVPAANPHNFFAFSDGARNCVGRRLAVLESSIAIATLVRDLTIGIDPDFVLEKRRRFVTSPATSMPIIFHEREW